MDSTNPFLTGLGNIVQGSAPSQGGNPFIDGLNTIVKRATGAVMPHLPSNTSPYVTPPPLGPVPHIDQTPITPHTNQFATDFIASLPENTVRGFGLGALLDIPQAYKDMKAAGGHVTPSDVLSGIGQTGQGLAHLATDVITKPAVGVVEVLTGQKNLSPTLPILGKITSPQQDVEEMVANGVPRWQAIAQVGANQAMSGGAFVEGAKGGIKGTELLKNKVQETYQNTNPQAGFAKVPGLTGNETPQELNDKIKADAEKRHPKVQISDEGIPLARKNNSLIPQAKTGVQPNKVEQVSTLPTLPQTETNVSKVSPTVNYSSPQDTINKVNYQVTGDTPKERVQSAVTNSERVKNEIVSNGQAAYSAGSKLTPHDIKLAEEYETGTTSVPDIVKRADNPKQMQSFMDKMINYYDFRLAADHAAGGETAQVANYIPHQWDLTNPAKLDQFNQLAVQKGLQPYNGFKSQPRVFDTYAQGEVMGFKRANPNILEDLKNDYGAASHVISKQVLKQGLKEGVPSMVTTKGFGRTITGKPFVNSNIPGLEGLSYDPLVHKQLKGFQPLTNENLFNNLHENIKNNPTYKTLGEDGNWGKDQVAAYWQAVKDTGGPDTVGSLYDKANKTFKTSILNFSGFHSINISLSVGGKMLLTNPLEGAAGILKSLRALVSEDYTQNLIDKAKTRIIPGTKQNVFGGLAEIGVNVGRELNPTGVAKYNPLKQSSHLIFDRELYTLKLSVGEASLKSLAKKGVPFNSPEAKLVGRNINKLMGELNIHTDNINPNTMKWIDRGLLAGQFTGSKFGMVKSALKDWGKANPLKNPKEFLLGSSGGNFARQAVIGKSILMGILSTFGTLLMTGKFPSLQQVLLNTVTPTTQTNLTNPKGQNQDITYPKTFIGETTGALTDTKNYLENRLAPAFSTALKIGWPLGTGTDQYGNKIIDPNKKESTTSQMIKGIGTGLLPIGAQAGIKYEQGKISAPQALISIGGLGTKTNPNDPAVLRYKSIDDAKTQISNIAPDDPERTEKMQAIFNNLTPSQEKSLNYQLFQSGISTKGVLSSAAGKIKPLYDKLQTMIDNGQEAQAQSILDGLSDEDAALYDKVATYYQRVTTTEGEKKIKPVYDKIQSLIDSGKSDEAQSMLDNLSDDDAHYYELLRKKNY